MLVIDAIRTLLQNGMQQAGIRWLLNLLRDVYLSPATWEAVFSSVRHFLGVNKLIHTTLLSIVLFFNKIGALLNLVIIT